MDPKGLGKRLPEICCGMDILTIMFLEETVTTAFCSCIQCQYTVRVVANTKVCGTPIERQKGSCHYLVSIRTDKTVLLTRNGIKFIKGLGYQRTEVLPRHMNE